MAVTHSLLVRGENLCPITREEWLVQPGAAFPKQSLLGNKKEQSREKR
jgi:hypothetical protein